MGAVIDIGAAQRPAGASDQADAGVGGQVPAGTGRTPGACARPGRRPCARTGTRANVRRRLRLTGYDCGPDTLAPGGNLRSRSTGSRWPPSSADYTTFVHLVNANGDKIAQATIGRAASTTPLTCGSRARLLSDKHTLTLPADLGRGPYTHCGRRLYEDGRDRTPGRPEEIGMIGIARPADTLPAISQYPLTFTFDNQLALNGYEMHLEGDVLSLRLYWQALRTPRRRLHPVRPRPGRNR